MDIFAEIKNIVKPKMLALRFLGEPYKKNANTWFYYSPLRAKERTASLAVNNDKGFTDFGTGKNYDIFSFISELYNCNIRKSCDIIASEFNIDIGFKTNKKNIDILKKQMEEQLIIQEKINNWCDYMYNVLTNIYKEYRNLRFNLPIGSKSLAFVYKKEQYFESLVDLFYESDTSMKLLLYKNKERFDIYERKGRVF